MPNELQHISTFDELVIFLKDEIGWELGNYTFEDLTFEYDPEELGLTGEVAAKVKNIHQLRPAAAGQPWGIFFVEFESQKMPVQALRRILSSLVVKKRAATNAAHRAAFKPADLLFIARFGTDKSPEIAFARFHQEDKKSIPSLKILGWNGDEAPPKLARVKQILCDGLAWPDDETDHTAWRDQWAKAFEQVVVTPDIQLKINQHIVQTYIKAGSGATGYMRSGELSQAAILKSSAIERLTEEEEYALFIHIDELKNGIPNDLYALGFLTQRCIEVADTLLKGKERFDQVIESRKIESRERYMKGLPKLCEHLESIHKECEEILFCNSDISEVKTTEQRKCLAENLEKRRNIMLRFHFNELVMEKFYEYVDAYDRKYQACQRNLRNEPDDTTLRDELVSFERNSWLAPENWNRQFGAISKARKEIALLRDILMRSCFSQVEACAKGHAARGFEHEELLGEGMKGIANAVMTFNVSLGKRLSARAYFCIRGAVTTAINKKANAKGVPVHMIETINKLMRVKKVLMQEYGREPSAEEIAEEIHLPVERVRAVLKIAQEPTSLQAPVGDSDDTSFGDFIDDKSADNPMEEAGFSMLKDKIKDVLDTLTEREREVLERRFGFKAGFSRTLEEVGRSFQVTRERIRQIEAKAMRKPGTTEDSMPEPGTTP